MTENHDSRKEAEVEHKKSFKQHAFMEVYLVMR